MSTWPWWRMESSRRANSREAGSTPVPPMSARRVRRSSDGGPACSAVVSVTSSVLRSLGAALH
ncbi:hypothetical protein [Amycolatopsis sp. cmx-4-54]|uniref:hypothetical protein n=1 Tax=Amycolatopsis sp. cmx-4-54 TaxID=2790936 RepID=UPI00397A7098